MTIYLSTTNHAQLFDFMQTEGATTIQKFTGKFSFSNFCKKDMRKLGHALYVAIELDSLKDSTEELSVSIKNFELQFTARLIFVTSAGQDALRAKLHELEQHNIVVLSADEADVQQQIRECLSCEGMSKPELPPMVAVTEKEDPRPLQKPAERPSLPSTKMEVLVAGTQSRVGTTTAALQMVIALAEQGVPAAYVEANQSGHLVQILHQIGEPTEGGWQFGTALFLQSSEALTEALDVVVYDLGVLSDKNMDAFCSEDTETALLVGCVREHELAHVYKALERIGDRQVQLLLTNVPLEKCNRLTMLFEGKQCKVQTVEHVGDWQDGAVNADMWRSMVEG